MHMYFWWGTELGDYIFKGFTVKDGYGMIGICLLLFALSIIYESMKVYKTKLRQRPARELPLPGLPKAPCLSENSVLISASRQFVDNDDPTYKRLVYNLKGLTFYILDSCISYFIMMSLMLYNVYMFVAVLIGTVIGFFIFGHMSRKINMENVQARTTAILCVPSCPDAESSAPSVMSNHVSEAGSSEEIIHMRKEKQCRDDCAKCCHSYQNESQHHEPETLLT